MSGASDEGRTAVVVAGDQDTRVLLRGLLRLHHFRILGEAAGVLDALTVLAPDAPGVLVIDGQLSEGSVDVLLREARQRLPQVRLVVVTHGAPSAPFAADGTPDAVLVRPFRLAEFALAVGLGPG